MIKLQNGSDVRGIALDGVPGEEVNLTPERVNRIVGAFLQWLSQDSAKPIEELKVGIGHDSRLSAESLKVAALKAIAASGAQAYDCGLATTPSMFMGIIYPQTKFDGSIMITASHLPFNRNGLKFFTKAGGLEKQDVRKILEMAEDIAFKEAPLNAKTCDIIAIYSTDLKAKICSGIDAQAYSYPLQGLKIIVDAGNGASGFFVDKVLKPLGADTTGSQFLEPDGHFPNHIPNPENKKAMDMLKEAVLANGADIGLIFDTDGDRMSAVLSDGSEINRDYLIALMAAILVPEYPHSTIITDSVTSDKLTAFLEGELQLHHHRYKRGYKNVIDECIRLNKIGKISPLAIETSGHGALKENYYLDDGAYLAIKLLIASAKLHAQGRNLRSLIEKMPPIVDSAEYRMKIKGDDFAAYGKMVLEKFEQRAKKMGYQVVAPSYEGVRLRFDGTDFSGWALLRQSLHDPQLPLNVEGDKKGDGEKIRIAVKALLDGFERLDTSVLG